MVARKDQQRGRPGDPVALQNPGSLQHPDGRRPDRDDPAALGQLGEDRPPGGIGNPEALGREFVIARILDPYRGEGPVADVKDQVHDPDAALAQPAEHLGFEVQTGGRSRHRAWKTRVDRLIPLPVHAVRPFRYRRIAADVGRQGRPARLLRKVENPRRAGEDPDLALSPAEVLACLQADRVPLAGEQPYPWSQRRPGERPEEPARSLTLREDEHFDAPAAHLLPGRHAGRNHPGDVPNQQILRPEQRPEEIRKSQVRRPAARPEMEQPGVAPRRRRRLRNEFRRQVVLEVGCPQTSIGRIRRRDQALALGVSGNSVPEAARPRCLAPRSVIMRPFAVRRRKPR